jgi:hypothetical protein
MALPREAVEIEPGLWRWTVPHPDWRPASRPGSTADWDRDVGCVACVLPGALVFVDALIPDQRRDLWEWVSQLARGSGRVLALTTIKFHRRSRDALVARLGAGTSRARSALPSGIEKIDLPGTGEVHYWLPRQRALVTGDRILGAAPGGLRLCPESWLGYLGTGLTHADLRERLRPLRELPAERVLVSHGEPVLERGDEALAKLIG